MPAFNIGDRVALPQVGTGSVVAIGPKIDLGSNREFYQIRPDRQSSTIFIPTDLDPGERGLRRVMTAAQATHVLELLTMGRPMQPDAEWRRSLRDRARSGELEEQAALVRDLHTRMSHKRLSAQERSMLEKAQEALAEELTEALGTPVDEVRSAIVRALAAACEAEKTQPAAS